MTTPAASATIGPSGDQSGLTDTAAMAAAIASLPGAGGLIVLAPGAYWMRPAQIVIAMSNAAPVSIVGYGATIYVTHQAAGDLIRYYNTAATPALMRPVILGLTIDGTSAAANTTGLHAGDCVGMKGDLVFQNFTAAGTIGLNVDNTVGWFEQADMRCIFYNCLNPVTHRVTTGHASFGYSRFDYTIFSFAGQQGLQLIDGPSLYHGSLRIRGDFDGSNNPLATAVISMSGAAPAGTPNAGATSQLLAEELDVQVECFPGKTFTPQTLIMDAVDFAFIGDCYGIMDFSTGAAFSPATVETGQFNFSGIVNGDSALNPVQGQWASSNSPVVYRVPPNFGANGTIPTTIGDMFAPAVLSGNITIALVYAPFSADTLGVPQRITIKIQQAASGGPFTVTWPKPGSPTAAAPAVYWPGGTPPVMTITANAVDVYDLETIDGIHWYGVAHQNMS
jgi:hypothetical protein